ncbi:MAG: DUF5657 family protein [Patescibacteria group bacterium]|nr:DUF5657 family protein [Patescibacteria group bacterium]
MTPFDKFLQFLVKGWRLDVIILGKIGALLLLFIYFMFSLVVIRQVDLMAKTIHTQLDRPLKIAAYLLTIIAAGAFILGIWIL